MLTPTTTVALQEWIADQTHSHQTTVFLKTPTVKSIQSSLNCFQTYHASMQLTTIT